MALEISKNGFARRTPNGCALSWLISASSSSEGGISGVLITDHSIVATESIPPI